MPVHVAWLAGEHERPGLPAGGPEPAGGALTAGEERALMGLVEGCLALGTRWLTVRAPSGGHPAGAAVAGLARLRTESRELGPAGTGTGPAAAPSPPDAPSLTVLFAAATVSGRVEIVDAVRRLAAAGVPPAELDERSVARSLYAPGVPDPDLLVRTGGDRRVPDLLLWEVAYSELVFLDVPWVASTRELLSGAVAEYQRRDRRYGGLVASGGKR